MFDKQIMHFPSEDDPPRHARLSLGVVAGRSGLRGPNCGMLGMPTEQPLYLAVRQEFVFRPSLGVVADDTCKILFAAFDMFTDSGMSKRMHVISVGMFTSERARTRLD